MTGNGEHTTYAYGDLGDGLRLLSPHSLKIIWFGGFHRHRGIPIAGLGNISGKIPIQNGRELGLPLF